MKYFCILLSCPFLLLPQTEFVNDAAVGIKGDIGIVHSDNFSGPGTGAGLGVSFFRLIDMGYEHSSFKLIHDVESSGEGFYMAVNLKSAKNNVKLIVSYSSSIIKMNDFDNTEIELSAPAFGIVVSPRLYETESIFLMPSFSVAFVSLSSSKNSDVFVDEEGFGVELDFNIVGKISEKFFISGGPFFSKDLTNTENPVIYGLNLGVIYSVPKRK